MDKQTSTDAQLARQIADQLSERDPTPFGQIRRILQTIGPERMQAFVGQALEIEARGGMMLPDGSRKRTLGGVFFRLGRTQVSSAEAAAIQPSWQQRKQRRKAQQQKRQPASPPAELPPFQWEAADRILPDILQQAGEATTVKLTLVGRPNQVVERQGVIILGFRRATTPSLPKRLPALPPHPTTYMIFVSHKLWQKMEAALTNPDDQLIIEGYPIYHPRFSGFTVYATQVTTKLLQAAKRQAQASPQLPVDSPSGQTTS
jgi:hypothetical protein